MKKLILLLLVLPIICRAQFRNTPKVDSVYRSTYEIIKLTPLEVKVIEALTGTKQISLYINTNNKEEYKAVTAILDTRYKSPIHKADSLLRGLTINDLINARYYPSENYIAVAIKRKSFPILKK